MIVLDSIIHSAINPAFRMLPRAMDSDAARVQILATGGQESGYQFRVQRTSDPYITGPARSFWQIKRPAIQLLLENDSTKGHMEKLCKETKVPYDAVLIHSIIGFNDILGAGVARLLYWADFRPIPGVNASHEEAWQCYFRVWKPEYPRRERWDFYHQAARGQVFS